MVNLNVRGVSKSGKNRPGSPGPRQAKANFEKEERQKELKRFRGEETWLQPEMNERIEQLSQEHSVEKKEEKRETFKNSQEREEKKEQETEI